MTLPSLSVAIAQMTATPDVASNLSWICEQIAVAAARGANFVAFPENAHIVAPEADRLAAAEPLDGRFVSEVADAAAKFGVCVLLGSIAELSGVTGKSFNTSILLGDDGGIRAVYRKMHLFDVQVAADTIFRESDTVVPGPATPTVGDVFGWKVGLTICYDLRFPELFRALSAAGATILAVPAAFTVRTGSAHWHLLLRARAVENFSYVVAPGQCGKHFGSRESYGHSLAVGPWGEILAEKDAHPGLIFSEFSAARVQEVRSAIPALTHRRL